MDIKLETERAIKAISDARITYVQAIRVHLKCIGSHDAPYHYADISLSNAEQVLTDALRVMNCGEVATSTKRRPSLRTPGLTRCRATRRTIDDRQDDSNTRNRTTNL